MPEASINPQFLLGKGKTMKTKAPNRAKTPKGRPSFGKSSYDKRSEDRRSSGSATTKPKRFAKDEAPKRGEKPQRAAFGKRTERAESFSKSPSRHDKKAPNDKAKRFPPRDRSERPERSERSEAFSKPTSRFGKKPSFKAKSSSAPRPFAERKEHAQKPIAQAKPFHDRGKFQPKREKLNLQGVLLWGLHAVREAWLNPKRKCHRLWVTDTGLAAMKTAIETSEKENLARPLPLIVAKGEIDHILPQGSVHQGIALEVDPLPERSLDDLLGLVEGPELIVLLDQVTDPHNIGAILRSAAALGAGAVIVTERNAPSATGIMGKTACGALEHVPLISVVNIARAIETLQEESYWCVGLAEEGEKAIGECTLVTGRVALVLGAEGEGLRRLTRERCDELVRLPTQEPITSLNVSNAAAVALYEVKRQRDSVVIPRPL